MISVTSHLILFHKATICNQDILAALLAVCSDLPQTASYHSHKVIIMDKPRLFLKLIFIKSDVKPNPNHTAHLMHIPNLKLRPKGFLSFHAFLRYSHFLLCGWVTSDNPQLQPGCYKRVWFPGAIEDPQLTPTLFCPLVSF